MGPVRARLLVALACVSLVLPACGGGSTSTTRGRASTTADSRVAWSAQTQQLCTEKRAAIARLGSVHITYAGIARVGLPRVKLLLERYLNRLLGVLRTFQLRQARVEPPPSLRTATSTARRIDAASQRATMQLKQRVAAASTPSALSSAFNDWSATLRGLSARGERLAAQLNLPACR